jgi:Family of unknown function (DUF5996)
MWTQIVGKTRMALEPLQNHWWNVVLYVTPVGLSTSAVPCGNKTFEVEFDFIAHRLVLRSSEGRGQILRLYPRSVADFYNEYMSALRALGIEVRINRIPSEFDDSTPFDEDRHHVSYDTEYVERFHRVLVQADRVFKKFRSRFLGKSSPVHFFWGSFDLAVTRFSGERAPVQPNADRMTREGYSHEVISCGFWPGDRRFKEASFYAYAAPAPSGLAEEPVRPEAAGWNQQLSEFILRYEDIRTTDSPEAGILDFCQSTYEAAAKLARWNRTALERKDKA